MPCLTHDGVKVWDTLAIGEYLNEVKPKSGLLPADRGARAHCRAVCGEMHSGFSNLRSALPMNLKRVFAGHKEFARAQADIERITAIWRECLATYGGPFLFGKQRTTERIRIIRPAAALAYRGEQSGGAQDHRAPAFRSAGDRWSCGAGLSLWGRRLELVGPALAGRSVASG